jgi:acetyltransferase-like isoleucine patch superfamily enzyme
MMIATGQHDGKAADVAVVKPIKLGSNVFVGRGTILMPGTVLGDNVIVGAGSVVRGTVESGAVVMGNPAKQIGTVHELYTKFEGRADSLDVRRDA